MCIGCAKQPAPETSGTQTPSENSDADSVNSEGCLRQPGMRATEGSTEAVFLEHLCFGEIRSCTSNGWRFERCELARNLHCRRAVLDAPA